MTQNAKQFLVITFFLCTLVLHTHAALQRSLKNAWTQVQTQVRACFNYYPITIHCNVQNKPANTVVIDYNGKSITLNNIQCLSNDIFEITISQNIYMPQLKKIQLGAGDLRLLCSGYYLPVYIHFKHIAYIGLTHNSVTGKYAIEALSSQIL